MVNHNSEFGIGVVPVGEKIISVTLLADNTIRLKCKGEPGALNRIESSFDLGTNTFATIAFVMADPTGAFQFDDSIAGTNKYYRLAYP